LGRSWLFQVGLGANASAHRHPATPGRAAQHRSSRTQGDALREWASDYAAHFMIKSAL